MVFPFSHLDSLICPLSPSLIFLFSHLAFSHLFPPYAHPQNSSRTSDLCRKVLAKFTELFGQLQRHSANCNDLSSIPTTIPFARYIQPLFFSHSSHFSLFYTIVLSGFAPPVSRASRFRINSDLRFVFLSTRELQKNKWNKSLEL